MKVEKDGYFHNSTRFYPSNNSKNYARFKLIRAEEVGTFEAGAGGQVTLADGGQIDFEADAVVTSTGAAYNGVVSVAATWLDPTAADLQERMPGDLTARNEDGNLRTLETFGMLGVELTGANGERLNLGNDKEAELVFPIPNSLTSVAPAEIPLWHFDEEAGLWIEEGKATLENGRYIGKVSHFSFWNCDVPYPLVELCATLTAANTVAGGDSLEGFKVVIISENNGSRCGFTDSNGRFCGKVPQGETLRLELVDDCGNVYFSQTIGPFNQNTDLGTIVVDDEPGVSFLTIEGSLVDCNNAPIDNGVVFVNVGGAEYTFYLEDDNTFSVLAKVCANNTVVTITAINIDDLKASDPQNYTVNPGDNLLNAGSLIVCNGSLPEFFYLNLDGKEVLTTQTFQFISGGNEQLGSEGNAAGGSLYMHIQPNGSGVGSYGGQGNNELIALWIGPDTFNVSTTYFITCDSTQQGSDCFLDQLDITEYGAVGSYIKGNFSGTIDYSTRENNMPAQNFADRPISGSFSILRTE
ncbi:MAG: hypothetical protein AAF990_09905 [Bacteroidota bacterium]